MEDGTGENIYAGNFGWSAKPPFYNLNIGRMCQAKAEDYDTCPTKDPGFLCNGTGFMQTLNQWVYETGNYTVVATDKGSGNGITKAFQLVANRLCTGSYFRRSGGTTAPNMSECSEDTVNSSRYMFFRDTRQSGFGFSGIGSENHTRYNDFTFIWVPTDAETQVYTSNRIASGAHVPNPFNVDEFVFKVNYASGEKPTKALLLYGDQTIVLKEEFPGDEGIVYTSENMTDVPEECVPYAFQFEYDGVVETYPEKGKFLTYGLGNCTSDYIGDDCTEGACCDTKMGLFLASGTKCRDSTACTEEAYCTGSSPTCPDPVFKSAETICRTADPNKPCEDDTYCTGTSGECPGITYRPKGTMCSDEVLPCQEKSYCDGKTGDCQAVFKSSTTQCKASTTDCVRDYFCTGTSNTCNTTDVPQPGGFICSVGKCSGFDTTCSRKIGGVTVKFTMSTSVSTEELADGIVNAILAGNKKGLLRIEKTDVSNGISVTVELENLNQAQKLQEELKKTGKLGDYGGVTDVSMKELFEEIEMSTSWGARISSCVMVFVALACLLMYRL